MESFEYDGLWWLPDKCDNKLPGKLTFDPTSGGRLRLRGQLFHTVEFGPLKPKEIGIILGEVDDIAFTLQHCYAIRSYVFPGVDETDLDIAYIYEGRRFNRPEDIAFKSVTVSYPHLDGWIEHGRNRFSVADQKPTENADHVRDLKSWSFEELAFQSWNFAIEPVEFHTVKDPDPPIYFRITRPLPNKSESPKQWRHRALITFTPDEVLPFFSDESGSGYAEFVFVRIPNFLLLATGRVNDPLSIRGELTNQEQPSSVSIYCPVLEPTYSGYQKTVIAFDDVKEHLPEYLSNWNDTYVTLREVYDLYFRWDRELHRGRLSNPTTQFLDMARALEAYHRRLYDKPYIDEAEFKSKKKSVIRVIRATFCKEFSEKLVQDLAYGNSYSFARRLYSICREVLRDYGGLLGKSIGDIGSFVRTVVDTRNNLTHVSEMPAKHAIPDDDLRSLHEYVTKMRMLLRVCFLVELKFPPDLVRRLMTENREYENQM